MVTASIAGFATGFSLILAIGAQNAFVLRQGLMRAHVFWICFVCALSDAVLITAGVVGIGSAVVIFPALIEVLTWSGAAFLIAYGIFSLNRALKPTGLIAAKCGTGSLRVALLTCLALTWLNPHVYLDTLGLIGAVSTNFSDMPRKVAFGFGAVASSFTFFFSLGYGARLLAPVFAKPRAWVILDIGIALVMWSIAALLLFGE